MAKSGRDYTTYFGGDSTGFSKAVGEMMQKLRELNKTLSSNKQE